MIDFKCLLFKRKKKHFVTFCFPRIYLLLLLLLLLSHKKKVVVDKESGQMTMNALRAVKTRQNPFTVKICWKEFFYWRNFFFKLLLPIFFFFDYFQKNNKTALCFATHVELFFLIQQKQKFKTKHKTLACTLLRLCLQRRESNLTVLLVLLEIEISFSF